MSASEDCTLKLWDASRFVAQKDQGADIEPYLTLRGHRQAILSLTGRDITHSNGLNDSIVLSGSVDGHLKAWRIPHPSQVGDPLGANRDQSYCIATWDNAHNK